MRTFRGFTFSSELNLWISALTDSLLHAFSSVGFNPRLMLRGLHFYGVKGGRIVAVRGGTDDFYHVIPGREGDVEIFIKSCLRVGSVFVDVGANIGYYTLIASKLVGSQGRIYSIEPVPSTATILKANVKLNNCLNVSVYEVAIWSSKGTLTLKIPGPWYGLVSVSRYGVNMVVNSTTLDELLKSEVSIDCIKIDVEGAELEVLRGAKDVLKRTKYLVIEVSRNIDEILKYLEKTGFKCKKAHFTTYVLCKRSEVNNYHEDLQSGPHSNMLIYHEREIKG